MTSTHGEGDAPHRLASTKRFRAGNEHGGPRATWGSTALTLPQTCSAPQFRPTRFQGSW